MDNLIALTDLQGATSQGPAASGGIPTWAWFIIIVLIILLVWWLLVRSAEQQNEINAHTPEEHIAEAPRSVLTDQSPEKASEIPVADDLTMIEGIGPKVNAVLSAAGIVSFSQLAEMDGNKLKELLEKAGFKYMDPSTWPDQARLLADGKMDDFETLVSNLKGGRAKR